MEIKTFKSWSKRFRGIPRSLMNVSNDINTWTDGKKVASIKTKLMDLEFLTASPIDEMYNKFVSPRLYSVLKDGNFCKVLGEEAYSNLQQVYVIPFALFFLRTNLYDVEYAIQVMRFGGYKIDRLEITLHLIPQDFSLEFMAREVKAAFDNGSWLGVEDFKSRFETGIGCGNDQIIPSIINNINAIQ